MKFVRLPMPNGQPRFLYLNTDFIWSITYEQIEVRYSSPGTSNLRYVVTVTMADEYHTKFRSVEMESDGFLAFKRDAGMG